MKHKFVNNIIAQRTWHGLCSWFDHQDSSPKQKDLPLREPERVVQLLNQLLDQYGPAFQELVEHSTGRRDWIQEKLLAILNEYLSSYPGKLEATYKLEQNKVHLTGFSWQESITPVDEP